MACLIDGPVRFEYFPTKVEGQRVENRTMKQLVERRESRGSKTKESRRSRHGTVTARSQGRLEKRAPFIKSSSQSQHGGMQAAWPETLPAKGGQSKGRRGHYRGVNDSFPKLGFVEKFSSSSSLDALALSPLAKEMISDCCLSEGRGNSVLYTFDYDVTTANVFPSRVLVLYLIDISEPLSGVT